MLKVEIEKSLCEYQRGVRAKKLFSVPRIVNKLSHANSQTSHATKALCRNSKTIIVNVVYERFLALEIFFNFNIYSSDFLTLLFTVVDGVIQQSLIDVRRGLYKNIVLSDDSSFNAISRFRAAITERYQASKARSEDARSDELKIQVNSHKRQRHEQWFEDSLLRQMPEFRSYCHTKAEYHEIGPSGFPSIFQSLVWNHYVDEIADFLSSRHCAKVRVAGWTGQYVSSVGIMCSW